METCDQCREEIPTGDKRFIAGTQGNDRSAKRFCSVYCLMVEEGYEEATDIVTI